MTGDTRPALPALPSLPAIVVGNVTHHRQGPPSHRFRHRLSLWLVDLDDLPRLPRWLQPVARFNSADHLGVPSLPIKTNVVNFVARHGVVLPEGGRVLMLASPRVLGHVFNPISVFWCYRETGELACIVAEVHNTYGERHAYLLRPDENGEARTDKRFYVSPFYDVSGAYRLRFTLQPGRVSVAVALERGGKPAFGAAFDGRPQPARIAAVVRQFVRQPLMPQRVSLLIRMHGLWLWARRIPVSARPFHPRQEGV